MAWQGTETGDLAFSVDAESDGEDTVTHRWLVLEVLPFGLVARNLYNGRTRFWTANALAAKAYDWNCK